MIEEGVVIKTEGDLAEVLIDAKSECEKCEACLYFTPNKRKIIVLNKIGAKLHDRVEVFILTKSKIKLSFLIYILPVLFFFGFYLLYWLEIYKIFQIKPDELTGVIFGFIGIFISGIILKIVEKIFSSEKYNQNYITRIIKSS